MRKGLTRTLMTVAIALVSVQVMAMAPMISDIPSPVVGGINAVTDTHKFVYPDAIDLNTMATDDYTATNKLMWSYAGSNLSYRINGVDPLDLTKVDPTSPTTSQVINFTVAKSETNTDAKANTVTIRNTRLAPFGGAVTFPTGSGIVTADTQAVTFFCSDGNTYSSSTVFFYTDNGGSDRLSIRPPAWTQTKSDPVPAGTWVMDGAAMGTVTRKAFNTTANTGVCLDVGGASSGSAANMGAVKTDYGYFTLAANTVYRIRAKMNSTQTQAGTVPFWDMILENYDGTNGYNAYGMDAFNLDNEGGANAMLQSSAGTTYDMIWAPAAVSTPQWNDANNGMFTSAKAAGSKARLRFRVIDIDSVVATQATKKVGSICLQSLTIESTPIAKLVAKTNGVVYNAATLTKGSGGNVNAVALLGSTITFASGTVKIQSTTTANKDTELATVLPSSDGTNETFPFHWDANEIYKLEVVMAAPDAASAANPFDVMWLGMDSPTNEINSESYITSGAGAIGMPKAADSTYVFFYNSNKETASGTTAYHNLRWRVRFANLAALNTGDNSGGVIVKSVKVTKVTF